MIKVLFVHRIYEKFCVNKIYQNMKTTSTSEKRDWNVVDEREMGSRYFLGFHFLFKWWNLRFQRGGKTTENFLNN